MDGLPTIHREQTNGFIMGTMFSRRSTFILALFAALSTFVVLSWSQAHRHVGERPAPAAQAAIESGTTLPAGDQAAKLNAFSLQVEVTPEPSASPRPTRRPTRTPGPTPIPPVIPPPTDPDRIHIMVAFGVLAVIVVLAGVWINRFRSPGA
jgi:hypothetical protein